MAQVENVERMLVALGGDAPPRLLVVGARALAALPLLAPALRHARVEAGHRIALLAILEHDDLSARLDALRAGADHALPRTLGLHALLAQAEPLLKDEIGDAPYRVLVVDDDAAQAAFAETVLRRAGMLTRTVVEPLATLDELERFQPDLILMDLNMPGADGLELTALIREREAFVSTPIVFLSGDPDADRQYAALDAGGDDFIAKPVRPKHLIAAVHNRVRRARAAMQRDPRVINGSEALVDRNVLFDRIARQLAARTGVAPGGGLLLVELSDAPRLRERLGLGGFDRLLQQFAMWVAEQTLPREVLAPFGPAPFCCSRHNVTRQRWPPSPRIWPRASARSASRRHARCRWRSAPVFAAWALALIRWPCSAPASARWKPHDGRA
ncbi:two-component system regulatory protein [mine drainage metagenome]|uniref:Two-component system regulatory protein n=1 Tax=mine drainage metagenome TaxID=410659 RepID=T1CW34_9ZZZZ